MLKIIQPYARLVLLCSCALITTGCASMFGSPIHSVRIDSEPQSAEYTITDEAGAEIASGTTPDTVVLKTSDGVFKRGRYFVSYKSSGYQSQTNKLNATFSGWYFVNLFWSIPGLIGMLVIDPFTGALYQLPDVANAVLEATSQGGLNAAPSEDSEISSNDFMLSHPSLDWEVSQ